LSFQKKKKTGGTTTPLPSLKIVRNNNSNNIQSKKEKSRSFAFIRHFSKMFFFFSFCCCLSLSRFPFRHPHWNLMGKDHARAVRNKEKKKRSNAVVVGANGLRGRRLHGIHERNSTGRLTSVEYKRQTRETLKSLNKKQQEKKKKHKI
jgi:hypothetical protein